MDFVIDGIFEISNLEGESILGFSDVCINLDVNNYVNVNENKNVNINNLKNVLNSDANIEILSINVNIEDINISKYQNKNMYIYCTSYVYILDINLVLNDKVKEIKLKNIHSYSFTYSDVPTSHIEIYPINLDGRNWDNKIYFNLNFAFIDTFKNMDICKNEYSQNKFIIENNLEMKENTNRSYSYINTNQEFM